MFCIPRPSGTVQPCQCQAAWGWGGRDGGAMLSCPMRTGQRGSELTANYDYGTVKNQPSLWRELRLRAIVYVGSGFHLR